MPLAAISNGFLLLCGLACPLSMGLMMWLMARGTGKRDDKPDTRTDTRPSSLAELKSEQQRLAVMIGELEEQPPRSSGAHVLNEAPDVRELPASSRSA